MRYAIRVTMLALAGALAMPGVALAAEGTFVVPGWLGMTAAAVGLVLGVMVLVQGAVLRRIAEGSILANNIVFMVLVALCLAASMLVRWVGVFVEDALVSNYVVFAADLLVIASVALVVVYLARLRGALQRYLDGLRAHAGPSRTSAPDEADGD